MYSRKNLQRELEQLEQQRSLLSEKLADLGKAKVLANDPSVVFTLEKQIEHLKNEREQAEQQIAELEEKLQNPDQSSESSQIDADDLSSNKGIDYTHLRNLLKEENWVEADEETATLMLRASGQTSGQSLSIKNIRNFPWQDLLTIDRLWTKYSSGHFGFSVQKQIWQNIGGTSDLNEVMLERFLDRVDWDLEKGKPEKHKKEAIYNKVRESSEVPVGYIPYLRRVFGPLYTQHSVEKLELTPDSAEELKQIIIAQINDLEEDIQKEEEKNRQRRIDDVGDFALSLFTSVGVGTLIQIKQQLLKKLTEIQEGKTLSKLDLQAEYYLRKNKNFDLEVEKQKRLVKRIELETRLGRDEDEQVNAKAYGVFFSRLEQAEHQQKLWLYEQEFSQAFAQAYPFDDETSNRLKTLHQSLGIKASEVEAIEKPKRLQRYLQEFYQVINSTSPFTIEIRQSLKELQKYLEIKDNELEKIEKGKTLNRYKQDFTQEFNQEYPFSLQTRDRLNQLQQALELTNEEAEQIEKPITNLDLDGEIILTPEEMSEGIQKLFELNAEKFTVHVPRDVKRNQRICIKGKGKSHPFIDYRGDLYLKVIDAELLSEKEIEYTELRHLLKAKNWMKADQVTRSLMLIAGSKEGTLDEASIQSFPCVDLNTIDKLWNKYSHGRFGLSVQTRIFNQVGKDKGAFAEKVGWRGTAGWFGGTFAWKPYDELQFSMEAPSGHLPVWGAKNADIVKGNFDCLLSRVSLTSENSILKKQIADVKEIKTPEPLHTETTSILKPTFNSLQCPSCNTANPTANNFCYKCGTKLVKLRES